MKDDTISRAAALKGLEDLNIASFYEENEHSKEAYTEVKAMLNALPPAQPEYEQVKAEDFAKTMSENTIYSFMAWHGEALELMERYGFVICKKTM